MPSRENSAATAVRSAVAASPNIARSRRSAVSTRSVRPVSGSIERQLPDVDELGLARVADLDREDRVAARDLGQGRAPVERPAEVGHDRHETRARARRGDRVQGACQRRRAGTFLGCIGREDPQQAEHPVASAGRWRDAIAGRPERDHAEPVRAAGDESTHDEGRALGHIGLAPVGRPEVHRRRLVEHDPRGQLAVRHVLADLRDEAAGRGVPVDAADVVAGLIGPEAIEVEPLAKAAAAMVAGQPATRATGQRDLEATDELVRDRPGPGTGGRPMATGDAGEISRHAVASWPVPAPTPARSSCGAGTRPRTRSTTESGVMPSVSAAYDSTSRWRRISGASSATSDGSA